MIARVLPRHTCNCAGIVVPMQASVRGCHLCVRKRASYTTIDMEIQDMNIAERLATLTPRSERNCIAPKALNNATATPHLNLPGLLVALRLISYYAAPPATRNRYSK